MISNETRGLPTPPRTRHRHPDGSARFTNSLMAETSPYLLQHAHNPVDWHAWGQEAFSMAAALNRPLFVSIGYSTCHWCHVMEDESFEDIEIAEYLNANFICVKVDREERPDVDAIYMAAAQIFTGSGGWPLNVVLTPALKPFFAGTYFPARDGDRGAFTGFLSLLQKIREAWDTRSESLEQSANEITTRIQRMLVPEPGLYIPDKGILEKASQFFRQVYDPVYGGMKGSPKFPASFHTRFLLNAARRKGETDLERMAVHTLTMMARGGIYDQVGGGFHRYSTDQAWRVPHFEKMLYDNALLVMDYLDAFQITKNDEFKTISCEVLDYAIREMRAPGGGFYSATDADSLTPAGEKAEGYFFTWTPEEIDQALDAKHALLAKTCFSMTGAPDFEGRYIPHLTPDSLAKAQDLGYTPDQLHHELREIKGLLRREREKRQHPLTDTKILSSWNGLMISALARAGRILDKPEYTVAADETARFILGHMMHGGRLRRTYTGGQARLNAYLDDYAFMTAALLDLHEADGNPEWLSRAQELEAVLQAVYEDTERGGFFMTSSDHETLIAREKPSMDGALPSGNAVAIYNMLRLYKRTGSDAFMARAEKALCAFSGLMGTHPGACGEMLVGLDRYYDITEGGGE